MASVCSSVLPGIGRPVMPQSVVHGEHPAVPEQPQALLDVVGVLGLVGVDEDQVVRAVAQLGSTLSAAPAISRNR